MYQAKVLTSYDLNNSKSLYLTLAVGAVAAILTYFVYQNVFVIVTILICLSVTFVVLSLPPQQINLKLNDTELTLGDTSLELNKILAWAVVEVGDFYEFVIRVDNIRVPFYYFYMDKSSSDLQGVLAQLGLVLPYDEDIALQNQFHNVLRRLGLK